MQSDTPTGDKCHFDIVGWSKGSSRSYFKTVKLEDFVVCAEDGECPLTKEDILTWKKLNPDLYSKEVD